MAKENGSFRSVSIEEEVQRAKWFKEDLDKGEGWTEATTNPGSAFWIKTFPEEEVPIKILFKFDLPFPARIFPRLLAPKHLEARKQWDSTFLVTDVLDTYPDGGYLSYCVAPTSFPLVNRSFVMYYPPVTEVDWYGRQAFFLCSKNAWHPSKPEGDGSLVRATHGGNFYVTIPDGNRPDAASKLFGLTNNNYNGWLPKRNVEFILKSIVPKTLEQWRQDLARGYDLYLKT